MNISAIDTLEAIVDGDTIVPVMNYVLPSGVGRTQYYNPSTGVCTPDYRQSSKQITLYPGFYSSNQGRYVVPDIGNVQWYLDNPDSDSAAILDGANGNVKAAYSSLFAKTTFTVNGQTFPALKIIGNLASADSLNDVVIYFKSTYGGITVSCHGDISIKESVGSLFDILINCVNEDGVNDTVIDNDSEYLVLTQTLQDSGADVVASGSYSWMRSTASGLVAVTHVAGVSELGDSGKRLKLYDGAIEGTEEYFACVVHNGTTYRKGIQVSDTHDPYYINIGRSAASNLVKRSETVTYTPQVLARSSRTVQSGWRFSFTLRDNNGDTVRSASNTTSFSVTGEELAERGQMSVQIIATKS